MLNNNLIFSISPHIKSKCTTRFIMINVCLALIPTYIAGIVYFGLNAFLYVLISVLSAILSEVVYLLIAKKTLKEIIKQFDFSSVVTGMLVGLTIGVNYPWYAPVLGSAFAIIVVKMFFGGTGKNIVNPAIVGRIFIFISFQAVVSAWVTPTGVETGATAIASVLKDNSASNVVSNIDLFLGKNLAGCIGETCKLAILIGAVYLALVGIIEIQFPIIYVLTCGLFQTLITGCDFSLFLPSILSGGLFIGAFFMSTDYVTTPNTTFGKYVYFVLLGLLTAGLRVATGMETVSFAILLMNLTVPLIDKFIINRPFGFTKKRRAE